MSWQKLVAFDYDPCGSEDWAGGGRERRDRDSRLRALPPRASLRGRPPPPWGGGTADRDSPTGYDESTTGVKGGGVTIPQRLRTGDSDPWKRETFFLFFFTLVSGRRRSLSLKLSDTGVYEPQLRETRRERAASPRRYERPSARARREDGTRGQIDGQMGEARGMSLPSEEVTA